MSMPQKNILIVEDEEDLSELIAISLSRLGFNIVIANHVKDAKQQLTQQVFDLVLTDMRLPDGLGLEVITAASELKIKSLMMTAYASTEDAIKALKLGALDYLTKPVSLEKLRQKILDILSPQNLITSSKISETSETSETSKTSKELDALEIEPTAPALPKTPHILQDANQKSHEPSLAEKKDRQVQKTIENLLIGQSASMRILKQNIQQYANSQAPIVISGQTGTGKERVAQALHYASERAQQALVTINCASIPETLLESELFGYKKGAFSGAQERKIGLIQAAHQGTLFLDEIAEMPLTLQSKLLRVLQERKVRALGDTAETAVDIKVICATHQNLSECVKQGRFREDLFYRIHVLVIELPTLNQRRDDIPLLLIHFLQKILQAHDLPLYQKILMQKQSLLEIFDDKALYILQNLDYQGNIRQLENILQVSYLNAQIEARQVIYESYPQGLKMLQIKARHVEQACFNNLYIKNQEFENFKTADNTYFIDESERSADNLKNVKTKPEILNQKQIPFDLPAHIVEIENHYITQAIKLYGLNQSAIAKSLGLSLRQLRYRLEQYPELLQTQPE